MNNMAMVNVNNLLNIKDSRWLQLEVCREFQRNKCSRPDTECKFAHPPANVEVQNGRVTACYDSIKGRCNREKPPCKYFHPPLHLKDQLLINGRNHLALKNALMQQMGLAPGQPVVPGQVPAVTNPYLAGVTSQAYNPYFAAGPLVPLVSDPSGAPVVSPLGVPQQAVVTAAQQKVPRADRLETYPGMVAYKRPAGDKSGVPVYQPANTPSAAAYQQLMQLQQPFVPVSSTSIQHNNPTMVTAASANSVAGLTVGSASVQDHSNSAKGSLDSHGNETGIKRMKSEASENEQGDHHDGAPKLGLGNSGNDLDDEAKAETVNKRMRVQNVGSGSQANISQVSNQLGQNNAAYVAAAQSYRNALAAISYTGVALQTNKAQQQQASVPQAHGYPGSAAAAAAAAAFQQHHHHHHQQQQQQQQQGLQQQSLPQGLPQGLQQGLQQGLAQHTQNQHQQQQTQQQQLLSQYQAMAGMAAALANQGSFQGAYGAGQASTNANQSVQNAAANLNAANAGLNPFAAAAMNPALLASLPQFAAVHRAGLLATAQQQGQRAQFNPATLAAAAGMPAGGANAAAVAAFNPFGVQFPGAPGGTAAAPHPRPFFF